jgi:hypothetical protein
MTAATYLLLDQAEFVATYGDDDARRATIADLQRYAYTLLTNSAGYLALVRAAWSLHRAA